MRLTWFNCIGQNIYHDVHMAECIKVTAMFCGNCFYKVSDGEVRRCLERVSWPSNKKAHGVSLPRIKPLSVP